LLQRKKEYGRAFMTGSGEALATRLCCCDIGADAALVARIAAREPEALRCALADHAGALHRVAYRMVGDAHEAEDIVQEACLRLWDHAPRLAARHPVGSPAATGLKLSGWLIRVVTNLAIDRLRVTRRIAGNDLPETPDDAPLADALIEADERAHTARALIAALPDRQRAAIVLTYYEELPNAAAADALDMNIKAFESLLLRARMALRKGLALLGEGDGR
jgi:RNA polymerase sigma factor (sigma-70 family)